MTIFYPPCSPEDGYGAPCGYCSQDVCCYDHWRTIHAPREHAERLAEDDREAEETLKRLSDKMESI